MNLEKENLNEKLVFCVQKISHKLSVFKLKSGDYRVLKTYFLDSFGLKARALLSLPSSGILNYSENFYLNGIQTTEQSLTHEFIIDSFKPIESDFDINPLNSIELFQKIYRKSLASLMLERIDLSFYDSDMFLGQSSQELELLPSPYFSFSDFQSLSDILSELPADTIFSFAPYLMSGAKSNESDVQSHAIAISFFRYIRVNYLPKELELFYSEEEKDWDRDHRRNIERICSHLPAEFVEVARRCFTTSEANSFKSFHEFKFQFLVAEQKRKTQELGNQLAINMRFELLTQRHREILDKITDSIVQPINKKKGDCFLLQGSEESTNSKIIDEVLMAMPEKLVTILHLREEGRSLGVDFNPLYELLNQLLDLICIKLTNSNKLKTEFYESFQSEIIYLAAFNNDLQTVYKDIQISKDFIGIGQINDLELKNLTNKLLQFQLAFTKQILIVIDSKFRIGLSRSKTNSLDFLKLIENMPITIIGDYNPGSVGNNFNYRISEFGKDTVTEFKLEFLDEAEIEEFLLATGLVDHRSTFNLSRKLQSISRGSRENLNSIFSQAVSNKIVFVNSEGNIEWNFSLLTTSKFFLPNNYQPQEVFQGLSPGEKVILKRCALLEGGVDYSFLIQGIEKTGLSGVNKLLERGFISKTLDSKARVGYSVSNNNLRLEILSIMEKREKVFLSIQLARIMSDLDIHASPFIEGALWAQVADYLAANNDKKKAVNSLLSCARELLRISDYQSALSYLDIASIFLTSDSKKYYESVWGEYCVLMAVACFRNKKEKAAEDYFSKALEHSTDIYQTTRIRTEWINLCVLVGDHEKAIGLCEDNFQDLNF
ncbi:MAG: hypothetical protein VX642_03165, partial [Bdellovibrionota bacterium]|nr:hypothetical protein [Bdellovibrionota bacterium]